MIYADTAGIVRLIFGYQRECDLFATGRQYACILVVKALEQEWYDQKIYSYVRDDEV